MTTADLRRGITVECPRCGAREGFTCRPDVVCRARLALAERKSKLDRAESKKVRPQAPTPEGWTDTRVIRLWRSAMNRSKPWTLTHDEAVAYLSDPCWYCGDPSTGLDRIDPGCGYHVGNVAPACAACNWSKRDHSVDAWLAQMRKTLAHVAGCIVILVAACELQPLPIPGPLDLEGPCDIDEDCDEDLGEVCFAEPEGGRSCRVPCWRVEDCPDPFTRCGELVGERGGRRVCV